MNSIRSILLVSCLILPLMVTIAGQEIDSSIPAYDFALNFFKSVTASVPNQDNVVISPFSAEAALAMTFAGAQGTTKSEIGSALQIAADIDIAQIARRFRDANSAQEQDYTLLSANGLFVEKSYDIDIDFRAAVRRDFGANISHLDFMENADRSRRKVNSWVEEKTRNKIRDLLAENSVDASTKMIVVNAIYFKADWQTQFDLELTQYQPFNLANGGNQKVPFMFNDGHIYYTDNEDLDAKIIELPYKNAETSMVVILPNDKRPSATQSLSSRLDSASLHTALQGLFRQRVKLFLPKFRIDTARDISRDLQNLNITTAFSDKADFSNISTRKDLKISKAVQKVFIEVDERGTEAAAATGIQITLLSAVIEPARPPVFRADRPFIFLIRHNPTESILFMGQISNPSG